MADTKISAATNNATVASTDEFATNKAGASQRTAASAVKTFVNTAPAFAAGTASAGTWPVLASGTVLTTAEAGAMERNATNFYLTTDAGNRGIVPVMHFIRCNATRTLPNDTATNAIFNSPTNGRLTLETGCYLFEMMAIVTAMSATSGNAFVNILGAGTATAAAWLWRFSGIDNTTPGSSVDDDSQYIVTSTSAVLTAGTGTAMRFRATGTFEITAAGTLIPSIDQVTAAAAVVSIGSYFMCYRIGSDAVVSVGQWD